MKIVYSGEAININNNAKFTNELLRLRDRFERRTYDDGMFRYDFKMQLLNIIHNYQEDCQDMYKFDIKGADNEIVIVPHNEFTAVQLACLYD